MALSWQVLLDIYDTILTVLYTNTISDSIRQIPNTLLVILCVSRVMIRAITSSGMISSIAMNNLIRAIAFTMHARLQWS